MSEQCPESDLVEIYLSIPRSIAVAMNAGVYSCVRLTFNRYEEETSLVGHPTEVLLRCVPPPKEASCASSS
jgi:hypothetical protein